MTPESNRALVLKFYQLMSELAFDKMFELMADDGVWIVAGKPETFHHAGTARKSERIEALGSFTKVFKSLDMNVLSTTVEEDRVAVEARTRCETHNGLIYENELLVLIRCRDGKITSIYEHLDQQASLGFERALQAAVPGVD